MNTQKELNETAANLEAAGEYADAAIYRAAADDAALEGEAMPRTCHHLLPGDSFPAPVNLSGSYRTADGRAQIDWHVRDGKFSATGNYDGSAGQCLESIAEAYPEDNAVHRLTCIWRHCHLKPVRPAILHDLQTEREGLSNATESFYDHQASKFLSDNGLKFRATLSDTKTPAWSDGECGHHYRVTVWRVNDRRSYTKPVEGKSKLTFDFWGSIADARNGIETERPYSVLASISGEVHCPETFKDFCGEYGYESDSIKALQTFRRCSAFAKRLRAFFTEAELAQLSEIQ